MGIIEKLFGKNAAQYKEGVIYTCKTVPNNREVTESAMREIMARFPRNFLDSPTITAGADGNLIGFVLYCQDKAEADRIKAEFEEILQRKGLM
jgi:hypothetical protein